MEDILCGLNEKQIEAVKAVTGPVLVISGPGSGKTKCLTHRIAYLIASGVSPENILAVTFTNKAAGEIQNRISYLLSTNDYRLKTAPVVGTFHALGLRILRKEIGLLGYSENFNIADSGDQESLVKKVELALGIDIKRYPPKVILGKISKQKTELVYPENYDPPEFYPQIVAKVYKAYQHELKKMNACDFDDLISLPVKIFKKHPEILEKYQNRWQYILVDEYQDTSHDQYKLITMLAEKHRNIFCIGDDAQAIYMFREADIRNILNFQKDYPDGKVIMLEQNYRSTQTIIAAAQSVISKNQFQIPKELWTANDRGEKIIAKEAINERDEARYVIETIRHLVTDKRKLSDITILYRTHAQSRVIEENLISQNISYRIVGGVRFYERREIKDILAYIRFLNNPKDQVSFERICNVPPRGIGKTTLEKIFAVPAEDLIFSTEKLAQENEESKMGKSLATFAKMLRELSEKLKKEKLTSAIRTVIKKTGYQEYLLSYQDKFENAEERVENLKELLTVAEKFDHIDTGAASVFLEEVALIQGTDNLKDTDKSVTLMTMHSSKGLEFPVVFIVGLEEGLFPHSRTIFEPHELEEERRLCYVAITRAKELLYISFAKYRHIFGSSQANIPSRFVGEIPQDLIDYKWMDEEEDDTVFY